MLTIATAQNDPWQIPDRLHGYYYFRNLTAQDSHGRRGTDAGSSVPYACPACQTSYSRRARRYRLSPFRNFRTGFAKTTQLLATELFDVLRKTSATPKLVSFSDSRQDAAKAALDIERSHHEDLRRQILVESLRAMAQARPSPEKVAKDLADVTQKLQDSLTTNPNAVPELTNEFTRLQTLKSRAADPSIPLADVVETLEAVSFNGSRPLRQPLKPFLKRLVELGVHPVDETGTRIFETPNRDLRLQWFELFETSPQTDWKDNPARVTDVDLLRRELVEACQEHLAENIFSKNYETGLAYPCIPLRYVSDRNEQELVASFMRVLADSYRLNEHQFDQRPRDWTSEIDIRQGRQGLQIGRGRVRTRSSPSPSAAAGRPQCRRPS